MTDNQENGILFIRHISNSEMATGNHQKIAIRHPIRNLNRQFQDRLAIRPLMLYMNTV
jgi:hypothetical protein|tara:strand:+ start:208 stop:381 length:174 start_codon:yes stop_codon:yes gene_type:complete